MATNIKFLKDNGLLEAHKHFMALSEAYFPHAESSVLDEELPNEDDDNMGMPQDDPMQQGGNDMMQGGGGAPMGGNLPQDGMNQDGAMGGGQDMGAPPMGNEGGMDGGADGSMVDMGDDAQGDENPFAGQDGDKEPSDDGDTIDIDGLTKAQSKLNVKQNQVGRDMVKIDDKITKLIDTISALQTALDNNNSEIEALKGEFEKRNPTQTEKLNLRSLDSYPFNQKPNEYWEKKNQEGGYTAYGDNQEPTTKEYVITNNDVDNPSADVSDTFFKIDDDDIQTLDKLFNL